MTDVPGQDSPEPDLDPLVVASYDLAGEVRGFRGDLEIVHDLQDSQGRALNWARGGLVAVLLVALVSVGIAVVVRQVNCHLYGLFLDALDPDFNHDGKVTRKEQAAFELGSMDRNRDGIVTSEERDYFAGVSGNILDDNNRLHC